MGADQKRREARKRKFAALSTSEEADQDSAISARSRRDDTERQEPRKKQNLGPAANLDKTLPEILTSTMKDSEDLTVTPAATAVSDEQDEAAKNSNATKTQRFIVFIGLSL